MIETLDHFTADAPGRFDEVIDVRSPAEFAEDHVPGAINLPVLDDAERATVGTIYVRQSRLEARVVGAALVARNIARHLEGPLKSRPGSYAPLVYCWRGGQRSNAMATVLSQVGWRPSVLGGGYKTYRRWIMSFLYETDGSVPIVLLDGDTGSAKTDILARTAALGVQTLDLEALADHRGSLFGALPGRTQPSQKMFESRLASALSCLDTSRPILVEAESSKIGERVIPPVLWRSMRASPVIRLTVPAAARARYLVEAYGDIIADPSAIASVLAKLPPHLGGANLRLWKDLLAQGSYEALAEALMKTHYDPAYARARHRFVRPVLDEIELDDLSVVHRARAAERVARQLQAGEANTGRR